MRLWHGIGFGRPKVNRSVFGGPMRLTGATLAILALVSGSAQASSLVEAPPHQASGSSSITAVAKPQSAGAERAAADAAAPTRRAVSPSMVAFGRPAAGQAAGAHATPVVIRGGVVDEASGGAAEPVEPPQSKSRNDRKEGKKDKAVASRQPAPPMAEPQPAASGPAPVSAPRPELAPPAPPAAPGPAILPM
jgi:hypothetical protein